MPFFPLPHIFTSALDQCLLRPSFNQTIWIQNLSPGMLPGEPRPWRTAQMAHNLMPGAQVLFWKNQEPYFKKRICVCQSTHDWPPKPVSAQVRDTSHIPWSSVQKWIWTPVGRMGAEDCVLLFFFFFFKSLAHKQQQLSWVLNILYFPAAPNLTLGAHDEARRLVSLDAWVAIWNTPFLSFLETALCWYVDK